MALAAILMASVASGATAADNAPVVMSDLGLVAGIRRGDSNAYLGIPFAKPPVGALRWRPPAAPDSWTGVRDGTHFGANCYQAPAARFGPFTHEFMIDRTPVSEDCLYLNLWTPARSLSGLPVLVWIHGGGFGGGSGSIGIYDGARIAAKGAVVITINYRVGAFGFLAHPGLTAESPRATSGNYGLLDMIAALHWVQRNAAHFGGDPAHVTIAGQSAGAMAINDLLVAPDAKGLFAGAIAESGTAASAEVLVTLSQAEAEGRTLAAKVGANSAADLRRMSAEVILKASGSGPPLPGAPRPLRMVPNMDGKVIVGNPNDPATPLSVNVPLLTGYNRDEGHGVTIGVQSSPAAFARAVHDRLGAQANRVTALYPHQTEPEATVSANLWSRDMVAVTLLAWAQVRTRSSGERVYPYIFEHIYPGPESERYGSFHTSEVPYVFGVLNRSDRPFDKRDDRISEQIQAYWLNFMHTGNPNGSNLPPWPAVDADTPASAWQVMSLGDHFGARAAAFTPQRCKILGEAIAKGPYAAFP
jgi:para-nitrobenzyl esterase